MKKTIIILGAVTLAAILFYRIYRGVTSANKLLANNLPPSYVLASKDSTLIDRSFWKRTKVLQVRRNKERDPISILTLDDSYYLFIQKLRTNPISSLIASVHLKSKISELSVGTIYDVIDNGAYFRLDRAMPQVSELSDLYLAFLGDSPKIEFKSDSLISFYALCNAFSLQYREKGPVDLLLAGKQENFHVNRMSVDVGILQRGTELYILLTMPIKANEFIYPSLLPRIILGE